jgi:hypothetical protein
LRSGKNKTAHLEDRLARKDTNHECVAVMFLSSFGSLPPGPRRDKQVREVCSIMAIAELLDVLANRDLPAGKVRYIVGPNADPRPVPRTTGPRSTSRTWRRCAVSR